MTALSKDQPYPGLRPFDSGDEDYFFGRETQTRALRRKLEACRLVAVVGRSGCGKSSLVGAGLVPLLKKESDSSESWYIASFRPQGRPIAKLTSELLRMTAETQEAVVKRKPSKVLAEGDNWPAQEPAPIAPEEIEQLRRSRLDAILRRSSRGLIEASYEIGIPKTGQLLIIIDQFEEIFRYDDPKGTNTDEATAFVRLLTETITADNPIIHILLTMRLDFLGDCARFARLPEAISDGQFLVPNLSRADRRAAIEEPAKKAGKLVRPEVTQRLLNQIGEDPDQLPVLQHVLMRMWQHVSADTEITLKTYEDTGGVAEAISRHANQIFDGLPSTAHREAAERLFKAVSQHDLRGRSVRRATPLGEITRIVRDDDPKTAEADILTRLQSVIDAFRAPDCCFLMPPADEALSPDKRIDISHESVLRGWEKMAGKIGIGGWIAEEERNGRTYASLVETAQSGSTLPGKIARDRQKWWRTAKPNTAWAERYGNNFQLVKDFVASSARRSLLWRIGFFMAALLVVGLIMTLLSMRAYETVNEANHKQVLAEYRAKVEILRNERELLNRDNQTLKDAVQRVQNSLPPSAQQARQDLTNLLPDATVQRPDTDPRTAGIQSTLVSETGYLWLGSSPGGGNLITAAGESVQPNAVQLETQYKTNLEIYLRKGPPDRNYNQMATLGILPTGTLVKVLSVTPPYTRPSGQQYWAQVHVDRLALFTVYFQFAGGTRQQAQQLSKALQEIGYKIPGEERTSAAAGKHEARYFYPGQKIIGAQLASDTNRMLQNLGYSDLSVSPVLADSPIKSNTDGAVELWLEIPPK